MAPADIAALPPHSRDVSVRLYQAAIGPAAQQRYLAVFADFDAAGRVGLRWHGPACVSALNWLAARGLWLAAWGWAGAAALGSLAALGLGRLLFDLGNAQLAALFAGLVLLASLAWGLLANAFYHRVCNRRILRAVAGSRNLDEACQALAAQAPRRGGWATLAVLNAALVALVAAGLHLLQPPVTAPARPVTAVAAPVAGRVTPPAPAIDAAQVALPATSASASASAPVQATAIDAAPVDAGLAPASTPATAASVAARPAAAAPAASVTTATATATAPKPAPAPAAVPVPPRRTASATTTSTPAPQRGFAVQIGVFAQPANVRKAIDTLHTAALDAYAEPANPPAAEPLRVRAGPYATREQAEQAAERVRALALPAVVVRLRGEP